MILSLREALRVKGARAEIALALAVLTTAVVAAADLPLVWDGSNFLFVALNEQTPLLIFHRYIESLLTAPAVAASFLTSDVGILRKVFSVSYAAVPTLALVLSWLVVRRKRPDLFVWPVLGIGLALLPGRALGVAESLLAAQLSWPLFLAALVPIDRTRLALCVLVGLVVAVSHPAALVFLPLIGLVGSIERVRSGSLVRGLGWLATFLALAVVNIALLTSQLDPYEVKSARPLAIVYELIFGAAGPQLAGLLLTAVAAVLVHRAARAPHEVRRPYSRAAVTAGLAVIPFVIWAAIPELWYHTLEYRAWAIPATLPLFALAWSDARQRDAAVRAHVAERMTLSVVAATVMFVVLLVQSVVWTGLVARLEAAVASRAGCVPLGSMAGYEQTAAGGWAVAPLSIIVQGRQVHAFVAPDALCEGSHWPDDAPVLGSPALRPLWFRFQ